MKLIIITTARFKKENISEGQSIYELAQKRGIDAYYAHPNDFAVFSNKSRLKIFYKKKDVSDADAVLVRRITKWEGQAYEIIETFKKLGAIVVGDKERCPFPTKKMTQNLKQGDVFPKSLYFRMNEWENVEHIVKKEFSLPFLIKPNNGVRGRGVAIIHSIKEIKDYFKNTGRREFIIQEFLDVKEEYRVLVLGGKSLGACEKVSNSFVKNAFQGAEFVFRKNKKVEDFAVAFAKKYGAEFGGVDVVITKQNKMYILEINHCPGFYTFNEASGMSIEEKLVDYCIKKR